MNKKNVYKIIKKNLRYMERSLPLIYILLPIAVLLSEAAMSGSELNSLHIFVDAVMPNDTHPSVSKQYLPHCKLLESLLTDM